MKANDFSLTHNQQLVAGVLEKSAKPQSAYDILDVLRPKGLKAPLQIYRALDKLIDLKLVHRLESLNAFVCCNHDGCHDDAVTAFTICQSCGAVDEFDAHSCVALLGQTLRKNGFESLLTVIEIKGVCDLCRDDDDRHGQAGC